MTSEIDNLLKGSVTYTADYDAYKKLIGVANENLMPNASGVAPLAKQDAYMNVNDNKKTEAVQSPNLENAIDSNDANTLLNPTTMNNDNQNNEQKFVQVQDTILNNPISVENSNILSSLSDSKQEDVIPTIEVEKKAPIMDLQMPQITNEVIGTEPEKTDENLFIKTQNVSNLNQKQDNSSNMSNEIKNSDLKINEIVELINQTKINLKEEIEKEFEELKKTILSKIEANKETNETIIKPNVEQKVTDGNSLVDEALNQINSMVIPSIENEILQSGTTKNNENNMPQILEQPLAQNQPSIFEQTTNSINTDTVQQVPTIKL